MNQQQQLLPQQRQQEPSQQQEPQQQKQPQQQQQQQQPSSQPQMNDDLKSSNEQTDEDDCEVKVKDGASGIHFTMTREGKPSGQAYVEMESEENLKAALKKDGEHMSSRNFEVFPSKRSEMERVFKKTSSTLASELHDNCVRLRGLPFNSTVDDIVEFFQGLKMTPDGITMPTDFTGRSTGDAFVQFVSRENVEEALQKHTEKIRHRYIEVFCSSLAEISNQALQRRPRQSPYYNRMDCFCGGGSGGRGWYFDMSMRTGCNMKLFGSGRSVGGPRGDGSGGRSGGGGGGGWNSNNWNAPPSRPFHVVHMKGLPFKVNEDDIATFFEPLEPVDIYFLLNKNNRSSGEANVEFGNIEDAVQALSKDNAFMQHRCIGVFMLDF